MKLLRTPIPNAHLARLEDCDPAELLGRVEYCLKTGSKKTEYGLLFDAWGKLFSDLYLTPEELVDEMSHGKHRLSGDLESMLREFVRADCASVGSFVVKVIKNGGKIDRAALIMLADLEELAGIEYNGMTAIHLLVDACDKKIRPTLIRKMGKRLLSQVYDRRGIPTIFLIFSLVDICGDDLDAIAGIFSNDELRNIMSRSRTGNNALDVFTHVAALLKRHPPLERNAFYIPAAKDTKKEGSEAPVRIQKATFIRKNTGPQ